MLDAKYVRENIEEVETAMRNRNADFDSKAFLEADSERRELIAEAEGLQSERNRLSKEIGTLMKAGDREAAEAAKEEVRSLNERLDEVSVKREQADTRLREMLLRVPNLPDETTPVGKDESENPEIRRWGTPRDFDS